ncbi:BQ2448_5215 [Microbotryum intermedium]|uniref:BQ2448_5215 protein n=1 Tax=Microbotryum intermedium TaxID=269621 RepID=A0A238F6W0_9BASI|nr:BQ2448_5215 [Microbotryum intermedium]
MPRCLRTDASSSTTPSLYSIGRHTLSEPIGALRNVLEAIEGKRRQLATALDPRSENLDELLDCLLMVADVRCEARSENMFHQSSSLVGYLQKRAELIRALASLAALGPEYDPALDRGAWTAVRERRSTRPRIPFVYLRSLEATVREHLAWSVSFEQRFPGSALEERAFRARLIGRRWEPLLKADRPRKMFSKRCQEAAEVYE